MRSGLSTRVETRTLALFVACALIPVAAFAIFGFLVVTQNLRDLTQTQLDATTKNYGLLVFERLKAIDDELTSLARRYEQDDLSPEEIATVSDARATFRVVQVSAEPIDSHKTDSIFRRLLITQQDGKPQVLIKGRPRAPSSNIILEAQVDPEYLWNSDALLSPDARLCVFSENDVQLNCATVTTRLSSATRSDTGLSEKTLSSRWSLFLNATYQVPNWTVSLQVPESAALNGLQSFRWILPVTAALAVAIALLLASVFIRRSHAPLRSLADAANRIGQGKFSRPLQITSVDEYGRLTSAFNQMSQSLRGQFRFLRVLARMDRTILSRAGTRPAIESLLRRLPRTLECRSAAVLLYGPKSWELIAHAPGSKHISQTFIDPDVRFLRTAQIERRESGDPSWSCVLQHLRDNASSAFYLVPVMVKNELRAHLIVGENAVSHSPRQLQDIAQRLAVALDNDDWERTLWTQAHTDALTGLPNRLALRQHLSTELASENAVGAVLFIDLDRFKAVNDSLGHTLGDSLLQQVTARWQSQLEPGCLLARFGGDEFVAILPTLSRDQVAKVAQRLLEALREPCQLQEVRYVSQASIGIATYPSDGADVDVLLKHADIALYRAKSDGRGRISFFDQSMSRDLNARLELEHQLREAIRDGRIRSHFQPKLNLRGEIVGVEALARWQTAEGKWISPGTFIPLAEETGLIVPMGEILLRDVCRQIREWQNRGVPVKQVAVNISIVQMRNPAFAEVILKCLSDAGLEGHCLEIEVTESLFAENTTDVARQLTRLMNAGVRVAIDDFGTGFSSMSLLRQYPISTLKIDRSFVMGCHTSAESRALLKALVDVGHALNLEVVAEGVEQIEHLQVLQELHCDLLQGFLFAPALDAKALEDFLSDGRAAEQAARSTG
ncbi:MAG: putative bifunctional diguanylate cyclase/phosphodiesterase [Povalibacter sp.]